MNTEDAIRYLRGDPGQRALVQDSYLDSDVEVAAARFAESAEFAAVRSLLAATAGDFTLVDLGSGNGIASRALAIAGVRRVVAVEPDPSEEIGAGAVAHLVDGLRVSVVRAVGEHLPLCDESVHVVYCRQVLHHTRELRAALREIARVLRPGGVLIACREHVVDDDAQLEAFLAAHPVHQLAGGENAFSLDTYTSAIIDAGLFLDRVLGPWDSVINAYPTVRSEAEREQYPDVLLAQRFGWIGRWGARVPGARAMVWRRLRRPTPGRLYSFLASKHSSME